jgi:xanthine dehydrogenase accessory factor
MSFCDAIFDGSATLAGTQARFMTDVAEIAMHLASHDLILITTLDLHDILTGIQPAVLVDARMRKHSQPETQINLAPFTIGLGPNFVTGMNVHTAVETGWNDELGKVIWQGSTKPLEGEPQTIAGHARDRYVYAPIAGIFRTSSRIGDVVSAGQKVAQIEDTLLHAPISGIIRGLTHSGVPVTQKAKVIEVDPRGDQSKVTGIAERPRRIALGVLEAIKQKDSQ